MVQPMIEGAGMITSERIAELKRLYDNTTSDAGSPEWVLATHAAMPELLDAAEAYCNLLALGVSSSGRRLCANCQAEADEQE